MKSAEEFKTLFTTLMNGGLGLERLHEVVQMLVKETFAGNPALEKVGWSQTETLGKIEAFESIALRQEAIEFASRLLQGRSVQDDLETSKALARAETAGKIGLAEYGLCQNEAGEAVLLPEIIGQTATEEVFLSDQADTAAPAEEANDTDSTVSSSIIQVDFRKRRVIGVSSAIHI